MCFIYKFFGKTKNKEKTNKQIRKTRVFLLLRSRTIFRKKRKITLTPPNSIYGDVVTSLPAYYSCADHKDWLQFISCDRYTTVNGHTFKWWYWLLSNLWNFRNKLIKIMYSRPLIYRAFQEKVKLQSKSKCTVSIYFSFKFRYM